MPVRQALKTRTIFNILGPLINPARPNIELMGVYDASLVKPIAQTMAKMGLKRAAVVYGSGLDEVAIHGETLVAEIKDGVIVEYRLTPADFGLTPYPLEAIRGGEPEENKVIITNILTGKGTDAQVAAVAANVALLVRLFGHEDLKANTQQAIAKKKRRRPPKKKKTNKFARFFRNTTPVQRPDCAWVTCNIKVKIIVVSYRHIA